MSDHSHHSPESPREKSKSRRQRQRLSCAECRRVKLKCDRQVPCSTCVKRKCAGLCPKGTMKSKETELSVDDEESYKARIQQLEMLLAKHGVNDFADVNLSTEPIDMIVRTRSDSNSTYSSLMEKSTESSTSASEEGGGRMEGFDRPSAGILEVSESATATPTGHQSLSRSQSFTYDRRFQRSSNIRTEALPYNATHQSKDKHPLESMGPFFPFGQVYTHSSYDELKARLPSWERACLLVDNYYTYSAWNYDIVPREIFFPHLHAIYEPSAAGHHYPEEFDKLSLVFSIMATGVFFDLGSIVQADDAGVYYNLAKTALAAADFLNKPTLTCVESLHIMSHYLLGSTSSTSGGDSPWPFWGLSMRLCEMLGLHRDAGNARMSPAALDERRRVFWEVECVDIFQSNDSTRPNSISPGHFDTHFPQDIDAFTKGIDEHARPEGFSRLKFQVAILANKVLDENLRAEPSSYEVVTGLWQQICAFEIGLPYYMRCKPARAIIDVFPLGGSPSYTMSPSSTDGEIGLIFQRHTLASNLCKTILALHRPYFARALLEHPNDPLQSEFAASFLAVVERCNMFIAIAESIYHLFPEMSLRHWFFWYHAFSSAVCLRNVVKLTPRGPLSDLASKGLDTVVALFESAPPATRPHANRHWLLKLKQNLPESLFRQPNLDVSQPAKQNVVNFNNNVGATTSQKTDELQLNAWTARLLEEIGLPPTSSFGRTSGDGSQTPVSSVAGQAFSRAIPDCNNVSDNQGIPSNDVLFDSAYFGADNPLNGFAESSSSALVGNSMVLDGSNSMDDSSWPMDSTDPYMMYLLNCGELSQAWQNQDISDPDILMNM